MVRKGSSSKAKAKAASKAVAKAKTVRGAASSKAPAQTLLEQDGRASGPSASTQTVVRRALKRQTSEAQAHKAIKDNFKGWSDLELNAVVYEDLNLFQRLRRDKRAKMDDPSIPMGATYYRWLREKYSPENAHNNLLQVPSQDLPISEQLVTALADATKQSPSRELLAAWLLLDDEVNAREVVGILRFLLSLHPWLSSDHADTSFFGVCATTSLASTQTTSRR